MGGKLVRCSPNKPPSSPIGRVPRIDRQLRSMADVLNMPSQPESLSPICLKYLITVIDASSFPPKWPANGGRSSTLQETEIRQYPGQGLL